MGFAAAVGLTIKVVSVLARYTEKCSERDLRREKHIGLIKVFIELGENTERDLDVHCLSC